jgi:LysM repeat protein
MGIPVEDLSMANDDLDPAQPLSLNQPIFIPAPAQRRTTTTTTYRAQQADSLASIAHRHGIQVEELIDHNPSLRGAPAAVEGREYVIPPPRPAHHRDVPQHVVVEQRTTVQDISKQYGVSVDHVLELNPSLNRSEPIPKGYSVRLPPPTSAERWEESNKRAVVHYSHSDETVDTIAHRYGVSADEIRRSNPGLAAQGYVPAGRRIVVREADGRQTTSTTTTYVVADQGASVDRIAELHGVSAAELRAHNGWDDSFTRAGPQTRVVVPPPRRDEVWNQHGSRAVHHRAQPGETVASVAYRHGVSVEHVRRCNPALRGDTFDTPQEVVIVESGAQREAPAHHVTHVIRQGDDMASVARAYGVDESSLRAANASRRFEVHQTIVIPPSHHSQSHSVYEVGPAETSREVAIRYGVQEHDLVAANPSVRFASGRRQQIVIPAAGQNYTSEAQHFETVHVAPAAAHETPEMVAERYGVGASELSRSNVAVNFESSMPSRIILPQNHATGYSAPPPTTNRRHTAAHVETYDVYERTGDESVDAVAERHGLPREAILALNPDFGRSDSSVLLPPGSTQRAAVRHGDSDMAALRRADAAETAVGNRDVLLDRYERVINDLQSGRAGDGRTAASQLEFLMHEYERVSEELQRCASANRAWEAHCRALGDAAGSKDEASLRHELARVATELHHAKAHFAEHERRVRSDMEREFTRRARVLDRAHREEAERLKAEMEHRLLIASGDAAGDHTSRSLQVSKTHSGAARDSRHEGTPGYAGPTIADLEPFLQYKDDTHAKLVRDHQDLQQQYQLISARCTTLDEKFETMAFAIDSRPSLLKIVFDLHKLADASSQAVEDLALRLSVRDIPRRQLQQELGGIAADARDLARSHHWIIGNLFTEVEVMHLGASPAHYSNTVDPRLAVNAPAKNPLTPQKKKPSIGSPARGRSSTPVRVMRTTTTTTTTTIAKAPRPSTARGF